MTPTRFRFGDFILSGRQRILLRDGHVVPLIPRYFDLLMLLIRQREDAVSKETIFAEVWSNVIVSDGALSQAIRTLRRTLGDDVREARFIRTVSRHGYQFVFPVVEEADERSPAASSADTTVAGSESVEPLVERLLTTRDPEEARDLAERLHEIGTADALARLSSRPRHAPAVAVMRDTRWAVPNAGEVPLLADAEAPTAVAALIRLRLADVTHAVGRRWAAAAGVSALGGLASGIAGGITLYLASSARVPLESAVALGAIGAAAGAIGGAGIGAGLVTAEALARSRRTLALMICGGLSGAMTAALAALVLRALLTELFGLRVAGAGGAVDGLVLGAAIGAAYGAATRTVGGGLAAPHGAARVRTAALAGAGCAAAAVGLAIFGRPLVGGLVHEIARSSQDSALVLAPLGPLVGETDFGPITRAVLSACEGTVFGFSVGWGLTYRPSRGHRG